MSTIIFDIETSGKDFDSLEKTRRNTCFAGQRQKMILRMSRKAFHSIPLTGRVITIGILNPDTGKERGIFPVARNTNRSTLKGAG